METLKKYDVEPMTPWRSITELAASPDGKSILFTRVSVNDEDDAYDSHVWITLVETGESRQFTHGLGKDFSPLWSPDGGDIYFLSTRSTGEQGEPKARLWKISLKGGEARPIVEAKHSVESPQLSPDGRRALFISSIEEESEARGDAEETDVIWVKKLIYKQNGVLKLNEGTRKQLFVASLEKQESKQLTAGPFNIISAAWSPDGERIAFVTNMEDYDGSQIRDVYVVDADGGTPRKVTDGKVMTSSVSWSPDGALIAYTGYEPYGPNYRGWRNTEVWLVPAGGGRPRNITKDFDRTIRAFNAKLAWSPDSEEIFFPAPDQGANNIYKVGVQDGEVVPIIQGKQSITTFDVFGADNSIAYTVSEATTLDEIWIRNSEGTRRLTDINGGLAEKWGFVEPEEFWFEASDGVRIQGWIMRPLGFREGESYPTIMDVHGGPMGFHGYVFNHKFQVLARHGYAVIYVNPRMSTGYGESFAAECCGHYGEKDYSDLMEALDYAIGKYTFIDSERLGVQGHSYGGFMMNWIVGHTNRFKACVSMASISNWESFFGLSDIGTYWVPWQVGFGKDPWESRDLCSEKAPLTYVDKVETPILLMHPEKDYRCPLDQSEQLFVALKKMGKETELIIFPDEHHLLPVSGKPSHRREWIRHTLRWFDRYLK